MSPSRGRPKLETTKSERLFIRVTPQEKAEIQAFSKQSGYSLLALIQKGIEAVKKLDNRTALTSQFRLSYTPTPEGLANLIMPQPPGKSKEVMI